MDLLRADRAWGGFPAGGSEHACLLARESGGPVIFCPYPTEKAFWQAVPPDSLIKHPISCGPPCLTYKSLFGIFDLPQSEFLSIQFKFLGLADQREVS